MVVKHFVAQLSYSFSDVVRLAQHPILSVPFCQEDRGGGGARRPRGKERGGRVRRLQREEDKPTEHKGK